MKKKINSLTMIFGVLITWVTCTMIIINQIGSFTQFGWTPKEVSNIVTAFSGIMAIFVSMFSVYLLQETLTSQQQGNKEQRGKADSDIIFLLLNQLEKEYDSFELNQTKGSEKIVLKGYEAISTACYNFKTNASTDGMYETVKNSVGGMKIMYLIRSFTLIREKIQESDLNENTQTIFRKKLDYYYRAKFKYPILFLTRGFADIEDPFIEEVRSFQAVNDVME